MALFLVPLYTRLIPPEQYGVLELFGTLTATLMLLAILGMDSALALFYYDTSSERERMRLASTALLVRLGVAVLLAGAGIAAASFLDRTLFQSLGYADLLRWTFAVFPFQVLQVFVLDYLRLRRRPWRYTLVNLVGVLLTMGIGLFLVIVMKLGVTGLIIANMVSYAVMALMGFCMVLDGLGREFAWQDARRMLAYGLPLVPGSVAAWVIMFGDRYFMSHYLDLAQIGIYAIGLKIASVMALASSSFQLAWSPFAYSIKHDPQAKQNYALAFSLFMGAGISGAVLLGLFASNILVLLVDPSYADAGPIIGVLALVPVMVGGYFVASIGLNLTLKTAYVSLATGLAAIVSLLANALFIPRWGIVGAAGASLAAQLVSLVTVYLFAQRFYPIPYPSGRVAGVFMLGIAALAAGWKLPELYPQMGAWLKLGVFAGYGTLSCLMLLPTYVPGIGRALARGRQG